MSRSITENEKVHESFNHGGREEACVVHSVGLSGLSETIRAVEGEVGRIGGGDRPAVQWRT